MLAFLTFFAVSLRHTEIIFTKTLWLKCKAFICTWLNLCLSERYKKQFLTEMCWTIQHRMQWSTVNRTMQGWDKSVFTDYTFVNGRRRTKRIVLDNIKPREVLVEEVKQISENGMKIRIKMWLVYFLLLTIQQEDSPLL